MKTKYKNWTEIDWDGNPDLGYKCFRKSFGCDHVSVGIGKFTNIIYSYGPNSDDSLSSTRVRKNGTLTEIEAMNIVDSNNGKYNSNG